MDTHALDLQKGDKIGLIHKPRVMTRKKVSGGGIAILYNKSRVKLMEQKVGAGRHEIVCATGRIPGN